MDQDREKRLGKYLLKSRLGKGGMGVVYLATDSRLKRDVALKVLPKSLSSDPIAVKRFLLEARVAARISHPNVVTIHDVNQLEGLCFLVMELLTGGTAQELIRQGPLGWWEATRIIADTCRGLAAIHAEGLIHRDIKPSNIMRAADGTVKLADFGLAKVVDSAAETGRLTVTNGILGTPQFMSPEQCQGEELDARSDLYSLGATYYALLAGVAPFSDSQPLQVMFAHCSKPVPDPRTLKSDIPPECVQIVMKALSKNRVDRFDSARDMLTALKQCLASDPTAQSRLSWLSIPVSTPTVQTPAAVTKVMTEVAESDGFQLRGAAETIANTIRQQTTPLRRRRFVQVVSVGLILVLVGWGGWTVLTGSSKTGSSKTGHAIRKGHETSSKSLHNGPITLEFEAEITHGKGQVYGVAFSDDGDSFYSGSMDGEVTQWSTETRQPVKRYSGIKGGIRALAAHDKWLVAGGVEKTLWVWNVNSEQPQTVLNDFAGEIRAVAISPDGKRLAVGTYSEARLYELNESGPILLKELGVANRGLVKCYMVHSVSFSSDSRWVAAISWDDKTVAIWDSDKGMLRGVRNQLPEEPMAMAFLPGDAGILVGTDHQGLHLADQGLEKFRSLAFSDNINLRSMALTANGKTAIVVGEWDGMIRLYDLQRDAKPKIISKSTRTTTLGISLSRDEMHLLTCGGDEDHRNGFIHLWKVVPESSE